MKQVLPPCLVLFLVCAFSPLMAQTDAAVPGSASDDYRIGIEDELRVFIWGENDLSVKVKVRPDGKITVPLVNDLYVVGLTSEEVRDKIRESLTTYIREPVVTVIVEAIKSYQIYFVGEVKRQGVLNFYRPTRLLQAIAAAGGLTEWATKDIILLREQAGHEKRTEINYKRLMAGDGSQENIYLEPGDTLLFK